MFHWTDSKIRVHAFYCLLGISLLRYVRQQAETVWPGLSTETLIEELQQIQQYLLLYPTPGEKGPNRVATPPIAASRRRMLGKAYEQRLSTREGLTALL